jgi:hypothetical protein
VEQSPQSPNALQPNEFNPIREPSEHQLIERHDMGRRASPRQRPVRQQSPPRPQVGAESHPHPALPSHDPHVDWDTQQHPEKPAAIMASAAANITERMVHFLVLRFCGSVLVARNLSTGSLPAGWRFRAAAGCGSHPDDRRNRCRRANWPYNHFVHRRYKSQS